MRRPRGIRGRLFSAVVISVVIGIGLITLATNLFLRHVLYADADTAGRTFLSTELSALDISAGGVVSFEEPADVPVEGLVWLTTNGRLVERPRVSASVMADALDLSRRAGPSARQSNKMRLYSAPVLQKGRKVGALVVGVEMAPYHTTARYALIASIGLAVAVLTLVIVVTSWTLRAALRPVAEMTTDAREWSEHDIEQRFDRGEPYDEITELAATLDSLLDRVAASLRREQRFSAELSHELRTPLTRIRAEAEIALRRPRPSSEYRRALETVLHNADHLTRAVDTLVLAAQQENCLMRGRSDAYAVIAEAVEACDQTAGRGLTVESPVVGRSRLHLGVDADVALRVIQPVVENASRYARSMVAVTLGRNGQVVTITVSDDGPGVREEEVEQIFAPGVRGSAALADGNGAGLGLTLARRLARAASGDVRALHAEDGGRFVIDLPSG